MSRRIRIILFNDKAVVDEKASILVENHVKRGRSNKYNIESNTLNSNLRCI